MKKEFQALAQEQEPVAWMHIFSDGNSHCVTKNEFSFVDKFTGTYKTVPLYTAPPSIEAAVLAEREACAKVCEEGLSYGMSQTIGPAICAAAIRARGEK